MEISIKQYKQLLNKTCKYKSIIEQILKDAGLSYVKEYKFLKDRKFRFDYAIQKDNLKIAIEYEGIFGVKMTRHTNSLGYSKDCEKYNLAQIDGWIVLRYTALTVKSLKDDLKKICTRYKSYHQTC